MSIIFLGCVIGFVAWFLVRYLAAGFYTVNQNERAVKTRFGRAERVGNAMTAQDPIAAQLTEEEKKRYNYPQGAFPRRGHDQADRGKGREPAAAGHPRHQAGRHQPGEHHRQHGGTAGRHRVRQGRRHAPADRGTGVEKDLARPGHRARPVQRAGNAEHHCRRSQHHAETQKRQPAGRTRRRDADAEGGGEIDFMAH